MPRILALTRYDRLGSSSRLRFLQFVPGLARAGIDVEVDPLLGDGYLRALYQDERFDYPGIARSYLRRVSALLRSQRYDLVWLEKEALPWIPALFETLALSTAPFVVDLDDAWFHRYGLHRSAIVRNLFRNKIDAIMRNAVAVTVGNEYLAKRAIQAGARRVEIIPTVIDLARYPTATNDPAADEGVDGRMVVGWIGTPHTVQYLTAIEPPLRSASLRDRVRLHVVGAELPAEFAGLDARETAWTEAGEVEQIRKFDIGVMPLDDSPWEWGKCGYKLLQVMAAGKPVIASPVGVNRQIVHHGVNGFLANSPEEWAAALRQLAGDPELRHRMGLEARKTVEQGYTLVTAEPRLSAVLEEAVREARSSRGRRPRVA